MSVTSTQEFGALLRRRRKELGLTLDECSAINGVGPRFLSELERGKATAEIGLALRVLASLGLELEVRGFDFSAEE